jgi:hypothetical protein
MKSYISSKELNLSFETKIQEDRTIVSMRACDKNLNPLGEAVVFTTNKSPEKFHKSLSKKNNFVK